MHLSGLSIPGMRCSPAAWVLVKMLAACCRWPPQGWVSVSACSVLYGIRSDTVADSSCKRDCHNQKKLPASTGMAACGHRCLYPPQHILLTVSHRCQAIRSRCDRDSQAWLCRNTDAVRTGLQEARQELMGPLSAASMESYSRAYPLLVKLHMLQVGSS